MNDDTGTNAATAATASAASAASAADAAATAPPAAPRAQAATVKPETVKPEAADPLFFSRLLRMQRLMEKEARAAKISSLSIV